MVTLASVLFRFADFKKHLIAYLKKQKRATKIRVGLQKLFLLCKPLIMTR